MRADDVSAFPESYIGKDTPHEGIGNGMTLRDYFAAKALEGILASCPEGMSTETLKPKLLSGWASVSYEIADAMLAERNKS